MFTIFPLTMMMRLISLPSIWRLTASFSKAIFFKSSSVIFLSTSIVARGFPFTEMAILTVSSCNNASLYFGQGS